MSKRSQKPLKAASSVPTGYGPLLAELKSRVRAAQVKAALSVNAQLVWLYWQVGDRIAQQQAQEGWGAGVIPRLAADLHAEFPELKGFSERNIGRMIRFSGEYPDLFAILPPAVAKLPGTEFMQQAAALLPESSAPSTVPQAAAQLAPDDPISILPQLAAKLPWAHHVILMEKVKDRATRIWYMRHAIEHGWSRAVLTVQIETKAHRRMGKCLIGRSSWIWKCPASAGPQSRAEKPSGWVFDGKLKLQVARPAKRAECPANIGFSVFDGYLMGDGFASCQPLQKSLNKMTRNQPGFVKNSAHQKRVKRREPLNFNGFPFDPIGVESSSVCSTDCSTAGA